MSSTILLIVLLSAHITGLISEKLLHATVGGSVLIPCSVPGNQSLTWFYWQESGQHFFQWDNNTVIKIPDNKYENRTQVFTPGFSSGNISITLDNISPEDDNKTFFARVKIVTKPSEEHCRSRLQVSAPYQHLDLTVNHTTSSATCRARGGYPAAQVSWKGLNRTTDDQLDLQDAETFLQQDPTEKTFSFTSSVNVTGLKSVTCFVYNPRSNETVNRTVKIHPPDGNGGLNVAAIVVPVVLVILILAVAVCVYLWRKNQPQDPPSEPPVELNAREGAQAEAPDAPDETVSLTGTPAALRRRTKSEGSPGRNTCEDAAASPEKGNLLESRSSVSENLDQN